MAQPARRAPYGVMEAPALKEAAEVVARGADLLAVGLVGAGALEALVRMALGWRAWGDLALKKQVFLRFAANLVLALEFALAADIAETAIAPTWQEIGQLAAIATIRTALNLFLERDLEKAGVGREARVD